MRAVPLLPCPFCGTSPKLHEPDPESGHAAVECTNKTCVMSHMWPDIVRWNHRAAAPDAPPALPDEPEIIGTMRKNLDGWDNRVVIDYIDALRAHREQS